MKESFFFFCYNPLTRSVLGSNLNKFTDLWRRECPRNIAPLGLYNTIWYLLTSFWFPPGGSGRKTCRKV